MSSSGNTALRSRIRWTRDEKRTSRGGIQLVVNVEWGGQGLSIAAIKR